MSEQKIESRIDAPFIQGCQEPDPTQPRASAAFVVLARNSEIEGVVLSMKSLERHFNQWYNYPWVFLNNEPFTEEFKKTVALYTSAEVEFGTVPEKEWEFSEEVDKAEFDESLNSQGDRRIMYGNLPSYHKMCRFYSGFFYKHELVTKRDWYWRVEPDVEFFCDLTYDPFVEMEKRGKKYGFTVVIDELYYTVPGLFRETKAFLKKNKVKVGSAWNLFVKDSKYTTGKNYADYDNLKERKEILQEIEDRLTMKKFLEIKGKKDADVAKFNVDTGLIKQLFRRSKEKPSLYEDRMDREEYNLCHFWSNFEIARTDLFTSEIYQKYFEHLDASGGFYRERWGDAPVHSLAIGMMLELRDVHYFRDIGYKHSAIGHCPGNSPIGQKLYKESENYSRAKSGIKPDEYWLAPDKPVWAGVGCRCRCPKKLRDVEDSSSSCIRDWAILTSDDYRAFQSVDLDEWEEVIEKLLDRYLENEGILGNNRIAETVLS
ncbi:glycosyltransferase family 15 protein [Suhomyces tanzawaensis NRRL Y-17324]|uniref:Glycosyltransferase family 15 protein n=1 Tax=Suhomyces tanzawaensis NRRL Y-17324 TaxID=984487 RepID=A0A1E4SP14_9ASCO|nr:glycosyltransferase family 15 protein [Suhomyces tanzawaensis NRRL Y-17324]ODV81236.1 glycosyltransferase family 15 protein [Suhomyces tanzawaensis NRRL Y-17324]